MKNITHILPNDKFSKFIQDSFRSLVNSKNIFVIVGESSSKNHGYAEKNENTYFFDFNELNSQEYLSIVQNADGLVIHSMTVAGILAIKNASTTCVVIWSGWGADYWPLLKDITKPTELKYTNKIRWLVRSLSYILDFKKTLIARKNKKNFQGMHKLIDEKIFNRVNYFSSIEEDFWLLQKLNYLKNAKFSRINYVSVEKNFGVDVGDVSGNGVLLGNSATLTNNHFEAFLSILNIKNKLHELYVPLSYGDKYYGIFIKFVGSFIFGVKFKPLMSFMDINKYNLIISSCSYVVMNHVRQQAIGNIAAMIYRGANIYMRPENTAYIFFNRIGVKIFDIKYLSEHIKNNYKLSNEEIAKNKILINKFWSDEAVKSNILMIEHGVINGIVGDEY